MRRPSQGDRLVDVLRCACRKLRPRGDYRTYALRRLGRRQGGSSRPLPRPNRPEAVGREAGGLLTCP